MSTGFTSITGTKFRSNATGALLASGRINCWPVNNQSQPVSATAGGGGLIPVSACTFLIVGGAITTAIDGSQAQLADTTLTNPANICYRVRVIDASTDTEVQGPGYDCVQPSGSTWSFDTYAPHQPALVTIQSGPPGPAGAAGANGTNGADGATTPNFTAPISVPGVNLSGGMQLLVAPDFTPSGHVGLAFAITSADGSAYLILYNDGSTYLDSLSVQSLTILGTFTVGALTVGSAGTIADVPNAGGLASAFSLIDAGGCAALEIDPTTSQVRIAASILAKSGFLGPNSSGGASDSDGWSYYTAIDSAGFFQICATNGSVTNQLTFANANSWGVSLSPDEARLSFLTDRGPGPYAVTEYTMTVGGCLQVPMADCPDAWLTTATVYFQLMGQSLSGGAQSGTPISTTQYGKNITLQGGPLNLGAVNGTYPTTTVPLIETGDGAGGGETPCSSMANMFAFLCQRFRSIIPTVAACTAGDGGHDLDQLFNHKYYGTPPDADSYKFGPAQYSAMTKLRASSGLPARLACAGFVHGEQDSSNNTLTYGAQLPAYYQRWITDLGDNGKSTLPPMALIQVASEALCSYPVFTRAQNVIAQQQMLLCMNNPGRFLFAGPGYCVQQNYNVANTPHEYAAGYRWDGMLLGAAAFRFLVLRQRYTGLMPKRAVRMGTTIRVPLRVPKPLGSSAAPLVSIDTSSIPAATLTGGLYGFEVRNAAGTIVPISSVTIVADAYGNLTVAEIVTSSDAGAGGTVAYAHTYPGTVYGSGGGNPVGPWGNIRDNDTCPVLPGVTLPQGSGALWNWLGSFYLPYQS